MVVWAINKDVPLKTIGIGTLKQQICSQFLMKQMYQAQVSWDTYIQFSPGQKYTEDKYYPRLLECTKTSVYFILFTETMFLNSLQWCKHCPKQLEDYGSERTTFAILCKQWILWHFYPLFPSCNWCKFSMQSLPFHKGGYVQVSNEVTIVAEQKCIH